MKPQGNVSAEAQEIGRNRNGDASDQECVCEKRRSGTEESREVTEDIGASDDTIQESQKTVREGESSVKMEPPDGGWGWMVAFASAVINAIVPVVSLCFSVLFSRYLLLSGVTSTTTAWIFNTENFIFNIIGLFVRPLSQEFGWRKVGVAGAVLVSFAFTITAFTPSPEFLFFTFSILGGIGGGLVTYLCFIVVPSYFTRRRGMANAIMGLGSGVGQIGIPPLLTFLQETFGDRGATLIFSGLMLHSCLAATTFHPVERHMKPSSAKSTEEGSQETKPQSDPQTTTSASTPKLSIFVRVAKAAMSDLGILRSRRACIIAVAWSLAVCSTLNFLMIVPFALQHAGFSLEFSAWCLSSLSVASLISRTVTSALTDLRFFRIRVLFVAGLVIMTVTTAVFPLLQTHWEYLAIIVVYGLGVGTVAGLNTLVMIEVMGMDRLAPLFGTSCLLNALCVVILGPAIGMIRDVSGSYPVSIWFMAGMMGSTVLLWTLMGQATKWDIERREEGRPNL